jgi:hypothetical protein
VTTTFYACAFDGDPAKKATGWVAISGHLLDLP